MIAPVPLGVRRRTLQLIDDRYELLEVISSGGMATVWRARDTRLERFVAVKRPHPGAQDGDSSAQLAREARAAASLSHPNLVTVFDFGTDETGPYLVMELVEGPTLQDVSGDFAAEDAVEIGGQLADALATIHAAGIVHRDVKPGNVIMSERGPLLTDFGIATVPDETVTVTLPGKVLATPAYAAPEVLAGAKPTPASDVYSLGMTISALVGGSDSLPEGDVGDIVSAAVSQLPEIRPDAAELAAGLRDGGTAVRANGGDPTLVLAVSPPLPSSPLPASRPQPGTSRRRLTPALLASGVLVAAAVALTLLGLTRADQGRTADATLTPVVTTLAPATSTTPAPTTTVPSQTTTTPPQSSVEATRNQLEALLMGAPRSDLNPPEVRDVMKKVDEAIDAASDGDDRRADQKLTEAARKLDEKLEGETQDEAIDLLAEIAEQLDVELDLDPNRGDREDEND